MPFCAAHPKFEQQPYLIREDQATAPKNNMNKTNRIPENPQPNPIRAKKYLALAAVLLVPAASTLAQSFWSGGTSDYNVAGSWSGPYNTTNNPNCANDSGSNNVVLIQPGDPVWQHGDTIAGQGSGTSGSYLQTGSTNNTGGGNWMRIAVGTGGTVGYYTLNGGVVNVGGETHIGEHGTALLTINGGVFNGGVNGGNPGLCMGDADWSANGVLPSDSNPVGTLVMNGGTINTAHEMWLGEGNSGRVGSGTLLLTNGSINLGSWFAIGRFGGIGDLEMAGGSITMMSGNNGNITLATTPGQGTVNQTGGVITNTATQTWVAESAVGNWTLAGGEDVLGIIHLTQNAGASGTFNLNGGDLFATGITDNGGAGTFNFNGGTLHAGAGANSLWMHDINGSVNVQSNAIINTEGNDVTISQALLDGGTGGGLIKLGAGTLTLSGTSFYSGPTIVSNGTLAVATATFADGTYTVKDSAGLGVVLANAGGQFSPATVTLGTTTGSSLNFDLGAFGNPTAAPLNVTGTLMVNGPTVVNIADDNASIGQFHLIQYGTKAGSGTFTLGTLPTGVVASLVPNGNFLDLNITAEAVDVWTGAASGNWDISSTINWANAGTLAPTVYTDGDVVQFDDTATGSTTVTLVTNVAPGTITFNNSNLNYTVTGNGAINGATHLTKVGAAMLTIENTNGYTGATIISGGTLVVSNLANGGVKSTIGASPAASASLVLKGGTLSYAGPSITINRGYSVQANYGANGGAGTNVGSLDLQGNLTLTGPVTNSPGTSFVKSGPGTLTYAGVGTNELSGGNDPGYQVFAGTLVFNGSAGHQVNHSQQEFWVGDTTNSGANIVLTNTTLNVDSWFSLSRGNGDSGFICNGSVYNSTMTVGNFSEGWQNGRPNLCSQVFTMTNSTLIDAGNFLVAESAGSVGSVYITGNSLVNVKGGNPMLMGLSAGATGNVVVANSSIVTNHMWLSCGANGYGTLTLKDNAFYAEGSDFNFGDYGAAGTTGIFTFQDNAQVVMTGSGNGIYVGKSGGAFGYVTQTGNTMLNSRSAGSFQLGQASGTYGQWLQSGGTNYAGGYVSIGRGYAAGDVSPTGLYIISGGLLDQVGTANGLIVGEQGTGTLIITNNGVVISEATSAGIGLAIGWNGGVGEVDLGGGILVANFIQSGFANNNPGGSSTFNFNGGILRAGSAARLNFMTNLNTATIVNNSTIDTVNNTIAIAQPLQDGFNGGGLTKIGSGTLLLDGANAYLGATIVSAGTLGGIGSLAGSLVVSAGATLSPGDASTGTLTLGGTSLSLVSTSQTIMKVDATASASSAVTGISTVTYGGTLVLQNVSGILTAGQTFTLFTAGTYSGSFSSVVSHTPGQTVTWDTSQLAVNGTVKVATAAAAPPVSLAPVVSGGNVNLAWPAAQTGWQLQEQANPLTVGISTNWVTVPGSTATNQVSIPVGAGAGSMFFRLVF